MIVNPRRPRGTGAAQTSAARQYWLQNWASRCSTPTSAARPATARRMLGLDNGEARRTPYKDIRGLLDWVAKNQTSTPAASPSPAQLRRPHDVRRRHPSITSASPARSTSTAFPTCVTFLQHTEAYRRDLRRAEYGDERDPKSTRSWRRSPPPSTPTRSRKPIRLPGRQRPARAAARSSEEDGRQAIRAQGTSEVWYVLAKDEGHGIFKKKSNRSFQLYATVLFVKQFLLN